MTVIDLSEISGLPLTLDPETGHLGDPTGVLHWDGPGQRRFAELRAVFADPQAIDSVENEIAYLTYRAVRRANETRLANSGLRYDVTVTLPGAVGSEFAKTAGHYHGLARSGVAWPEIYDVLFGEAAFVLQRAGGDPAGDPEVTRGIVVVAFPGDRLIIPPGYGHVTVDIGNTPLVVADLVAAASVNHYRAYAARRGGAVRIIAVDDEPDAFEAEWNHAYPEVDDGIEVIGASDLAPFEPDTPLYSLGTVHPGWVEFLTVPGLGSYPL